MISGKELRDAARSCEKAILEALPEPEDCTFSPAFERKMKKLILRVDQPVRYWLARILPVLLAAGIVAAAALLLSGQSGPSPAPPVAEELPEQFPVYRPTWLPEGCEQVRESLYEDEGMIVYTTPAGTEMTFLYAVGSDPAQGEDLSQGKEVLIGEETGLFRLWQSKGDLNDLFWTAGEGSFWLSAPFTEDEMIKIAESVEAQIGE